RGADHRRRARDAGARRRRSLVAGGARSARRRDPSHAVAGARACGASRARDAARRAAAAGDRAACAPPPRPRVRDPPPPRPRRPGAALVTGNVAEAVAVANRIAPEHLELAVARPERWLPQVRHAGAIFLGEDAPEPFGDYLAGPNHVLPTGGSARFSSPLGV